MRFLKHNDIVGIAASARKINIEELQFAIQTLENWGLTVKLAKNIGNAEHQFAGTDAERKAGLQQLLDDKSVKAIFMARGGYGTVRIIDALDFSKFKQHPKWIIGFSDITVLHAHLYNLKVKSIHGTMPLLFNQSEVATEALHQLLFGKELKYTFPAHSLNRKGSAEGTLIGGNLSVLYSLSASKSEMNFDNKILFLEDLDEYLYHIDRMMMQLKRANKLKKLKGLIVGGFTEMKDNTTLFGKTAEEIIYNAVKEYRYPVCFNFPAGHIKDNMPFIHGAKIFLSIKNNMVSMQYA